MKTWDRFRFVLREVWQGVAKTAKIIWGYIKIGFVWLFNDSVRLTAWATVGLAIFTFILALATFWLALVTTNSLQVTKDSLEEVRSQRELLYQQLRLENEPALQVNAPAIKHQEKITIHVPVQNFGGTASNIEIYYALFCCGSIESIVKNPSEVKWTANSFGQANLYHTQRMNSVEDVTKFQEWLRPALKEYRHIHLLVVVRYIAPPITLSDSPRAQVVGEAFGWNSRLQGFSAYEQIGYGMVRELAMEKARSAQDARIVELLSAADRSNWGTVLKPFKTKK